jgi:hypothetical protein
MIDLCDESFFVDISGIDRAYLGAGRMITMHTGSGKEPGFDMGVFPFDVGNEFDPVDRTTLCGLFRSDQGNIILSMAGNDTSLASRAFV